MLVETVENSVTLAATAQIEAAVVEAKCATTVVRWATFRATAQSPDVQDKRPSVFRKTVFFLRRILPESPKIFGFFSGKLNATKICNSNSFGFTNLHYDNHVN